MFICMFMCMFICMYMFMCMFMYMFMCMFMYMFMCMFMRMFMCMLCVCYVYVYVHVYVYVYVHIYVYVYVYVNVYVHVYVHVNVYTNNVFVPCVRAMFNVCYVTVMNTVWDVCCTVVKHQWLCVVGLSCYFRYWFPCNILIYIWFINSILRALLTSEFIPQVESEIKHFQ